MSLADKLIARSLARPYFHLYHGDGSLYMERYWLAPFTSEKEGCYVATWREPVVWLLQKLGIAVRIHCIHTPDLDRALHDHPWTFVSVVLAGWYKEERPVQPQKADFAMQYELLQLPPLDAPLTLHDVEMHLNPPVVASIRERCEAAVRGPGSIALRRFYHRHRIVAVSPGGVWTLFITFRKRQSWGFFTPKGKIWWWEFESVHNNKPVA